jgi:hypothetical protein
LCQYPSRGAAARIYKGVNVLRLQGPCGQADRDEGQAVHGQSDDPLVETEGPVLGELEQDDDPLVRGHTAWAVGRIDSSEGAAALEARLRVEEDGWVRKEIGLALQGEPDED